MPSDPLAYFISFTTYGTWLHGRDPGSVDRDHNAVGTPVLPPDEKRERSEQHQLREAPYLLTPERRQVVRETICEVAKHRGWRLWAAHVRTNHVHIIVSAAQKPERVMADFKAYASRRLAERLDESPTRKRWTQHGSTRYVWSEAQLAEKVEYVVNGQGEPMAVYDGSSEPET
jgi:REP element-mobilizing transposase RayT